MPVFSLQLKQAAQNGVIIPSASNPAPDNSPEAVAARLQDKPVSVGMQTADSLSGTEGAIPPGAPNTTTGLTQGTTGVSTVNTLSDYLHKYGLLGAGIAVGLIITTVVVRRLIKKKKT